MTLVHQVSFADELVYTYTAFSSLSTLVNIILAALVVLRLVYHRRCVRNALGAEHGSPYTNIITMCVESSALMVAASVSFTILRLVVADDFFVFAIVTHICVGGFELNDF